MSEAASEALRLARELVASGLMPALRSEPLYLVSSQLRRLAGWTVADLRAHIYRRVQAADFTVPAVVYRPAAYLRWLLADADPHQPPAQLDHARQRADQAAAHARTAAGRAALAAELAAAGDGPAGIARCRAALTAARSARQDDQAERDALTLAHRHHAERAPHACTSCGAARPDVRRRVAPGSGLVLRCNPCHAWTTAGADAPAPR